MVVQQASSTPELTDEELDRINDGFGSSSPQEVLRWALERFHPNISLAASFGAEDVALIDMLVKLNPEARVFCLETGRLHQETYDVIDRIREKYGISIEVYYPNTEAVEAMVRQHGPNLFYNSV